MVSTACSGTEQPVLALLALAKVLTSDLGAPLIIETGFACENSPAKQAMLRMLFPAMGRLFRDARDLGGEQAPDVIPSSSQPVEPADCIVAGFPCTDASRFNNAAASTQNLTCVLSGRLRTGGVYYALTGFIRRHAARLRFALFENVSTLAVPPHADGRPSGPSNLEACIGLLQLRGLHAKPFRLCPTLLGVPQQRARLYCPAVPFVFLDRAGICDAKVRWVCAADDVRLPPRGAG